MAEFVDAYDTTTGEKLPNQVPKAWLDKNTFPHLSTTAPVPDVPTVAIPTGDPNETWTIPQIGAYAERRGIDVAAAKTKPEYLAAVSKPATPNQQER